ncbi:MAG: glycosyltransferase, partial [Dehalococcoidia bacterium]|nr:glycosyltransferase [Dehalococcoidia bacterium]
EGETNPIGSISVIIPALNEARRLPELLAALAAQTYPPAEVIVVDGGSTDRTAAVVADAARRDRRVRFIDASPIPSGWNGKPWGLQRGWENLVDGSQWALTIDADVRVEPRAAASLVAFAESERLHALSVATIQVLRRPAHAFAHPALLTTLIYRFGAPGHVARSTRDAQANGQCALFHRDALAAVNGFWRARASRCEDVTIARVLVNHGFRVGFYESSLAATQMYDTFAELWANWPRSLPMRDQFFRWVDWWPLVRLVLTQALPLPLFALLVSLRMMASPLAAVNAALLALRVGALVGVRRAYRSPGLPYWLSPLADGPAVAAVWASALTKRHRWRGRELLQGVDG